MEKIGIFLEIIRKGLAFKVSDDYSGKSSYKELIMNLFNYLEV